MADWSGQNMTRTMKTLVEHIRHVRGAYDAAASAAAASAKKIVIGNASGDMDSVVSSLGYSYLTYLRSQEMVFPVLSFDREDLKLRKDIEYSLKKVGILEEDLIYANELTDSAELDIALVDHNDIDNETLKKVVDTGKGRVVGIVDHHVDSGKYADAVPRIITVCGSCSSLVLGYFDKEVGEQYGNGSHSGEAEFLITAIGIDTNKMSSRVEEPDRYALSLFHQSVVGEAFDKHIDTVSEEKLNIAGLTMYDLLRKDYKERRTGGSTVVGVSSVGYAFGELQRLYGGREGVSRAVSEWKQQRGLDVVAVMTSYVDEEGVFHREIALEGVSSGVLSFLKRELQLVEGRCVADASIDVYEQLSTAKSRKAVLPLIVEALTFPIGNSEEVKISRQADKQVWH